MRIAALWIASDMRAWLPYLHHARLLHLFPHACTLWAADQRVVSLVTPEIGPGPFSMGVPPVAFTDQLTISDPVYVTPGALHIGPITIEFSAAASWNPCPDWSHVQQHSAQAFVHIPLLRAVLQQHAPPNSLAALIVDLPPPSPLEAHMIQTARQSWHTLRNGVLHGEFAACRAGAVQLAGLGSGLTPAGDDWLVGCALAAHAHQPMAEVLLNAVHEAAAHTSALASAWIHAAVHGQCSRDWHTFLECLCQPDETALVHAMRAILRHGHTSGADALAGYLALTEMVAA
ncbi:MAG: DUF2877 domain-containing protein [Chloroflexi bacterium]|nr:DUF2877 domain-containing protein [Chloroflexota bacterium]